MTSMFVASSEEPETEGLTGEAPAKAPSVAPPVPPRPSLHLHSWQAREHQFQGPVR